MLVTTPTTRGGPFGDASLYSVGPSCPSSSAAAAVAPLGAGTAQDCSLAEPIELRLYVSASVACRCMVAGEGVVRGEVADSVLALQP